MDILTHYFIYFHGKSEKRAVPNICPFKKSKAFPGITYIFPPISICPELYTWPPLDAREVEKVSPTIEAGKEEGFGE